MPAETPPYGSELVGLPVIDVNGRTMGHVVDVDPAHASMDVELTAREARRQDASEHVVPVALDMIVDADDHAVTVREQAAFLVHPDQRPDPHETA